MRDLTLEDLPAVEVVGLQIELTDLGVFLVADVGIEIHAGEVLGLVGETGSGKSTVGMALLGHCRRGGRVTQGAVRIDGRELGSLSDSELRRLRGGVVSYIPQDPGAALNPALRISRQLSEVLRAHEAVGSARGRDQRVREALEEVGLPSGDEFLRRYPHQLSGGQLQRVAIAMAFVYRPRVIVCDEPTTGLDVTTQARVLETIRELCRSHRVGALYVSHDLAVVAELANKVAVMYAGRIVEYGTCEHLFAAPRHPYTRRLLRAVPDIAGKRAMVGIPGHAALPGHRPDGCSFHPRCTLATEGCQTNFPPITDLGSGHNVRCYHAAEAAREGPAAGGDVPLPTGPRGDLVLSVRKLSARHGTRDTLFDIDLEIRQHECLAMVGESGSGKTTLARCVSGLHSQYTGDVLLRDAVLAEAARKRSHQARREIQYVFQNPYASLNPRRSVGQTLARQLELFFPGARSEIGRRVSECLERVALSPSAVNRYPEQLSGGERQRVAIARALAAQPTLLVCDEITSALDVSVQAAIIALLRDLRAEIGLSVLFITHHLALIRTIADRVVVITDGRIVEQGATADILESPRSQYTRQLLESTPDIGAALRPRPDTPTSV